MRGLMWIRRSVWESTLLELQTVKRQYGERVALERRNLADEERLRSHWEDRYHAIKEQYDKLRAHYDELKASLEEAE